MPRIKQVEWAKPLESRGLVYDPIGLSNLVTAYVLDLGEQVMFIDGGILGRLGVDADQVRAEALRNIQLAFPRSSVQRIIGTRDVAMVKTKDSYDAARLLAVPPALGVDEELFAVISDDDTLALAWGSGALPDLKRMAKEWHASADNEKQLTNEVLRVSHGGISVVAALE
jgi:hypothetical protein